MTQSILRDKSPNRYDVGAALIRDMEQVRLRPKSSLPLMKRNPLKENDGETFAPVCLPEIGSCFE